MDTKSGCKLGGVFHVRCIGPDGKVKWEHMASNLIVNQGIQHVLDITFTGAEIQVDPWYIGLCNADPAPQAAHTLTDISEFTDYSGNRKEWVEVRSGQELSNTASKASFAITENASSIGGAFLCSAASGTEGTLMSYSAFTTGNKSADSGDTLEVTYTLDGADAG